MTEGCSETKVNSALVAVQLDKQMYANFCAVILIWQS